MAMQEQLIQGEYDYQFEAPPQAVKPKGAKYRNQAQSRNNLGDDDETLGRTGGSVSQQQNKYERLDNNQDEASTIQANYYYIDRPPTPEYMPLPPGIEKNTQIERYDWDLHDFDVEVEPILEVLVGRNLEQSRIELIEEWEDEQWRNHRREFEIRRNVELMKTQRMDKEYKRLTEEKDRRSLQRRVYYTQRNFTHKKLYGRVMSKSLLQDLGESSIKHLKDLRVLDENLESTMREQLLPWLVNESVGYLDKQKSIQQGVDRIFAAPETVLLAKHKVVLDKEAARLQKIEDDKVKAAEEKLMARKERREVRRLKRLNRDKTNLFNKIFSDIIQKARQDNIDPFSVRIVDFDGGNAANEFVLTVPGGLILQMYMLFSVMKEKLGEKTEGKYEDFFKRDSMCKYLVQFLLHTNIHPDNMTLYLNESAREKIETTVALGEKNLFEMYEKMEEIIQEIISSENLIPHPVWAAILGSGNFNRETYEDLIYCLLRIYFKSNEYKIPEEEVIAEPELPADSIPPQVDAEGNPIPQAEGDAEPKKPEDADAAKETTPVNDGKRKSLLIAEAEKPKYVIPDITPYDQEMVQAKSKLKLNFGEGHSYGTFDALVRLQFGLNRDITREELTRLEWEENNKDEKKRLETEAQDKSKKKDEADLWYEGRTYLFDDRRAREAEEQRLKEEREAEEKLGKEDAYIEQYYGNTYYDDFKTYPVSTDQKNFSLQKYVGTIPNKRLAFVNYVSLTLLWEKLEETIRADNKELNQIREVNLSEIVKDGYKCVEDLIANIVINKESPDMTPVYDFEL